VFSSWIIDVATALCLLRTEHRTFVFRPTLLYVIYFWSFPFEKWPRFVHPFPLSNLGIIVIRSGGYIVVTGKSRILRCDHIIQNQGFPMCYLKTNIWSHCIPCRTFFIHVHSEPGFTGELLLPSRCRRIFWRVKCSHLFCQSPYVIVLAWVNSSQVRSFWLRTYIMFLLWIVKCRLSSPCASFSTAP